MNRKNAVPSRKALQTAETAINRMKTRYYSKSGSYSGPSHFQAESYLWKKFISLDGECQLYTTMVLICMSLALLIWFFERGLLDARDDDRYFGDLDNMGVAERRLLRSLLLILGAILNGVIAFLLLGLNLRDLKTMPESVSIRWLFFSAFGFIGGNLAAIGIVYSAQDAYEWRRDKGSYEKPFPHYFILGVFLFLMWVMDVLYIREIYLPFFESRAKGWEFIKRNIPAIIQLGRRQNGETTFKQNMMYWLVSLVNGFVRCVNYCIYFIFHVCEEILQWWMRVSRDENSFSILKSLSRGISIISLLPFRFLRWSPIIQVPLWISRIIKRTFQRVFEFLFRPIIRFSKVARIEGSRTGGSWNHRLFRGFLIFLEKFFSVFMHFKPEVQKAANELWDNIKEDEEYKHSSWLKAAVTTASILLLYFGLKMVNQFRGYMDDVYTPTRNCIVHNPGVSNFFLRFIGFSPSNSTTRESVGDQYDEVCAVTFLTGDQATAQAEAQELIGNLTRGEEASLEQVESPYVEFTRQLDARVQQDLEKDRLYICEERRRQDDVCVLLSAVNLAEEMLHNNDTQPSDEFFGSFTGEVVYVFDVYMRHLDWAVWVGLIVGLLFGFWTLLSVMGQYKRLSLAIRAGLFRDFEMGDRGKLTTSTSRKKDFLRRVDSIIDTHSFAKVIAQYPMSVSVFFSGMLISTAILQLVVFGGLVASAVSLVASLSDSEVWSIVSPLLWMLLAFLVTWLVNGPIATLVLGEGLLVSHFQVVHEICFFLFLLVFTSIHLVIGIFLAFFRMLWVLLTSLVTINRLDKNLFTIYRERDLGHKSFMALVFMQHVFHVNRSGNQHQRSLWGDVLKQVEDEAGRNTLRRSLQGRTTTQDLDRTLDALIEQEGFEIEEDKAELGRSPFRRSEVQMTQMRIEEQEASVALIEKSGQFNSHDITHANVIINLNKTKRCIEALTRASTSHHFAELSHQIHDTNECLIEAEITEMVAFLARFGRLSALRFSLVRSLRAMSTTENEEVLIDHTPPLVIITLNRPKALNALNTSMIKQLTSNLVELDSEEHDARCIVIQGNGGKAFCAGGDVKSVTLGPVHDRIDFFRREYQMNYQISKLKKPVVCLLDGIVMGGGCGVAMHTPFRIATEKSVCAMPEGLIGFVPDVGSSYFLNRLPDSIGNYMAMTGKNLRGLELKAVGLATHYIASQDMPLVISKLQEMSESVRDHSRVDSTLKTLEVSGHLEDMDLAFNKVSKLGQIFNPFSHTLDEIFHKLETSSEASHQEALDGIKNCAPLSIALAYELLKRMAGSSLRACLETESTLAIALSRERGEFIEGVRALLVDKDKTPNWKYTHQEITNELIDGFFKPDEQDPPLFTPTSRL